jgi:hypothetical protein
MAEDIMATDGVRSALRHGDDPGWAS